MEEKDEYFYLICVVLSLDFNISLAGYFFPSILYKFASSMLGQKLGQSSIAL